jgi:hypothetical protein
VIKAAMIESLRAMAAGRLLRAVEAARFACYAVGMTPLLRILFGVASVPVALAWVSFIEWTVEQQQPPTSLLFPWVCITDLSPN